MHPATHLPYLEIRNPYSGSIVEVIDAAGEADANRALEDVKSGARTAAALPRHKRAEILLRAAELVRSDSRRLAELIVSEAGKTIRQAEKEVQRCENTLRLSGEEAKRISGEVIPFDSYAGAADRMGYFTRDPIGPILAITPFNDPLNLVAHKIGPAIAGGNAVVLKPSRRTPLSALMLARIMREAGLPENLLIVLPGLDRKQSDRLIADQTFRMITFTGGPSAGLAITRLAGLKKLSMDLGGNAPAIVLADCDMERAVKDCVSGAFWAAGQNCIGVQRILIEDRCYHSFRDQFLDRVRSLKVGDPISYETDMGPMIAEEEAIRVETWVNDAIAAGASVPAGNTRDRAVYAPTVVEDASPDATLRCNEAFAPVVLIDRTENLETAIAEANRPDYSLHAAIFTSNINSALTAANRLEAGGVMINDSSDFRFDGMPFGGYKQGGLGREGIRFALDEMTQTKVICFRRPGTV